MLIKVFATIGIQVQELPHLTVEAVRNGKVVTYPNRVRQVLRISPYVREELLQYIEKEGIATGPVFLTRAGQAHQQDHGDNHYPEPLPGCPCPRGKMQPAVACVSCI